MIRIICYLFSFTFLFSCSEKPEKSRYDPDSGTVGLPKNDKGFIRLMDSAQKHLPEFIHFLTENFKDTNYYYILKSAYKDAENTEHMWSYPIGITGDTVTCILIDSAYTLTNIKKGDTTQNLKTSIEDWAIFDTHGKVLKGNFSEKYLKGEE